MGNRASSRGQPAEDAALLAEHVRQLFVLFPVGVSLEMSEAYTEILHRNRVRPTDLERVVQAIAETRTSSRPPAVADLLGRCRELANGRARTAQARADTVGLPARTESQEDREIRERLFAWRKEHRRFVSGPEEIRAVLAGFPAEAVERFLAGWQE